MASFFKNYYTKSCPIRIIVVSLHSETARVKQVPVPAFPGLSLGWFLESNTNTSYVFDVF